MSRTRAFVLLLLLGVGFGVGRLSAEEPIPTKTPTVGAQHYQIAWADSALDLSHGAHHKVHEIYLPESKVAASLHFDHEWEQGPNPTTVTHVRVIAHSADGPRNALTGIGKPPAKIEDIEISADLAKELVAIAKLAARLRAESRRVGQLMRDKLQLKEIQHPRGQ